MTFRFHLLVPYLLCLLAAHAVGQPEASGDSAHELVEAATTEVMEVVAAADAYVDDDPERYYDQVQALLDPLIDYRGFARGVMGRYASPTRIDGLRQRGDKETLAQLKGQLDQFTRVMRKSLVRTYSKGLLAFGGSRIEVLPAEEGADVSARAAVRQHVFADRSEPYVVLYFMGRGRDGQWQLRNMIIEGVNLGEVYRDQFESSARDYNGDLDAVIANWTTVTVDVED